MFRFKKNNIIRLGEWNSSEPFGPRLYTGRFTRKFGHTNVEVFHCGNPSIDSKFRIDFRLATSWNQKGPWVVLVSFFEHTETFMEVGLEEALDEKNCLERIDITHRRIKEKMKIST